VVVGDVAVVAQVDEQVAGTVLADPVVPVQPRPARIPAASAAITSTLLTAALSALPPLVLEKTPTPPSEPLVSVQSVSV
jgi:hypothetical protein